MLKVPKKVRQLDFIGCENIEIDENEVEVISNKFLSNVSLVNLFFDFDSFVDDVDSFSSYY